MARTTVIVHVIAIVIVSVIVIVIVSVSVSVHVLGHCHCGAILQSITPTVPGGPRPLTLPPPLGAD
jgi:hypothetical protein